MQMPACTVTYHLPYGAEQNLGAATKEVVEKMLKQIL